MLCVTALVENTTENNALTAEHGLSLLIETKERRILFDMGQGDAFFENAKALGIALSEIDVAVLSHGHYDHGGGLSRFLRENTHAEVFVARGAFLPHYHGWEKYIGIDPSLQEHPRLRLVDSPTQLAGGIWLLPAETPSLPHYGEDRALSVERNGVLLPDDFMHEQYLQIEDGARRVLFSGCSHRGILEITRRYRPDVLVGGFHFSKLPIDQEMEAVAAALEASSVRFVTCHCTGGEAYAFLKTKMSRLSYLSCGDRMEL